MPKTIDPIQLLKEHIDQKKRIEKNGSYLIFDGKIKIKIDTPTGKKITKLIYISM